MLKLRSRKARLTIPQINRRYRDQWVLLGEPETDADLEILSGVVLAHSTRKTELVKAALQLKPGSSTIHFAGKFKDPTPYAINL